MALTRTSTPLRYPGGKSQLTKFVKTILHNNHITGTYIEPFAGGAGIAIDLLLNNDVDHIVINDFDPSIHAVWNAIINRSVELIALLENVPFDYTTPHTLEAGDLNNYWHTQKKIHDSLANEAFSLENAFATLMLNRMNVSGIINGGPIGGQHQSGKYQIDARFNKKTLISKIQKIAAQRDRIDLYNLDANDLISEIKSNKTYDIENTFIFFDPPYFVQGKNLYLSFFDSNQHLELANNILNMSDYYWITTYDYTEQISDMYANAKQRYAYSLKYSANRRGIFSEFMFASESVILEFSEQMSVKNL